MASISIQSTKRGARCGALLLLAFPLFAHAQFAVVSQDVSVDSRSLNASDRKTSDVVDSVTLTSISIGVRPPCVYDPYGGYSPPGCLYWGGSGAPPGRGSYSSTITPDTISVVAEGGGSGPDSSGGASVRMTLDVLANTDAFYSGSFQNPASNISLQRISRPDGTTDQVAVPLPRYQSGQPSQGVVNLMAGRYVLFVGASGSDYFSTSNNFSISTVPEPAAWGLMGVGLAGVALAARRRKPQEPVC